MVRRANSILWCLLAFCTAGLAAQESAPGPLVSGAWLETRLGDPGLVILHIDTRSDEYDAGHIPGARFVRQSALPMLGGAAFDPLPVDTLVAGFEAAGAADGVHIVLVARSLLTATRAWVTLDYLGHGDHASVLDGGTARWQADGRPLTTDMPEARTGSLTPRPRPGILADADWIAARLDDPGVRIIDGRREEQYTGEDGGMGSQFAAGHMPGAAWLGWEGLVESAADAPLLLPVDSLRTLFENAGAAGDRTVVVHCTIGTRASMNYFAARLLGYDVRFYEGSWQDWSARALPAVRGRTPR